MAPNVGPDNYLLEGYILLKGIGGPGSDLAMIKDRYK